MVHRILCGVVLSNVFFRSYKGLVSPVHHGLEVNPPNYGDTFLFLKTKRNLCDLVFAYE